MIIDFIQFQQRKFDALAEKMMAEPHIYLDFESVSDFYKSTWLDAFPKGTICSVSGLDDGAEQFYLSIQYQQQWLNVDIHPDSNRLCLSLEIVKIKLRIKPYKAYRMMIYNIFYSVLRV